MKNRGFTIAEALIVLAIIAIMSYLLFPLFMKVKSHMRMYSSINKLRQIHIAIENYRQAWDGADVFASYRSFYRLGLPPGARFDPVRGLWYAWNPWQYTETTHRDWWSPCATGIYEYDLMIFDSAYITATAPSYIELSTYQCSPPAIDPPPGFEWSSFFPDSL